MGLFLICRVTGLFAFGPRTNDGMKERILSGEFARNDVFNNLTKECQDLISHILEVDPMKRYSAEDALNHPWFRSNHENAINSISMDLERMDSRLDMVASHRRNGRWLLMSRKPSNGNSYECNLCHLT